jgi:DNA anti-recombination protein RmuC
MSQLPSTLSRKASLGVVKKQYNKDEMKSTQEDIITTLTKLIFNTHHHPSGLRAKLLNIITSVLYRDNHLVPEVQQLNKAISSLLEKRQTRQHISRTTAKWIGITSLMTPGSSCFAC